MNGGSPGLPPPTLLPRRILLIHHEQVEEGDAKHEKSSLVTDLHMISRHFHGFIVAWGKRKVSPVFKLCQLDLGLVGIRVRP